MFIILLLKKLAEEFEGQFEHIGENTEKKSLFSFPIEIKKSAKDDDEHIVRISYKIKLIHSGRFKTISLSSLVDNLVEGIHNIKCKDCNCLLKYQRANDSLQMFIL